MVTIATILISHLVGVAPDQSAIDDNLLGVKGTDPSREARNRRATSRFVSPTARLRLRFGQYHKSCNVSC